MESWKKGRLRGMREAESRARLAHLLVCGCVCVCGGLEGLQSWLGENSTALPGWHGASDCATSERTVQGLDGTPAGFESQLDLATEERRAEPCPIPGVGKDQGGLCVCGGGRGYRRGGKEMLLNLKQGKEEKGQWDHRGGEFLKSLEFKDISDGLR